MFEIVSSLTGRIRSSTQELAVSIAVYGIVGILVLTAYIALLYALGVAVSAEAGPLAAALSIAGVTLLLALIALFVLHMRRRRLRRLRRLQARSAAAAGTSAAVATIVPTLVRASPVGSLLAVAVLAYVMSRAGQGERRRR